MPAPPNRPKTPEQSRRDQDNAKEATVWLLGMSPFIVGFAPVWLIAWPEFLAWYEPVAMVGVFKFRCRHCVRLKLGFDPG